MTPTIRPSVVRLLLAAWLGCAAGAAAAGVTPAPGSALEPSAGTAGDIEEDGADAVIDFPLLAEARPIDLIDMELDFPKRLRELDGRRVSMVGFMAPFDSLGNMQRCMIVPTYVGCKFCTPPQINQVVFVSQGDGSGSRRSYPFIEPASRVTGTLRLSLPGTDHEGQRLGFIFSIENAVVRPFEGGAPERAAGHGNAPHGPEAVRLTEIPMEELVLRVAEITGLAPSRSIDLDVVAADAFGDVVRDRVAQAFPEATRADRTRAFSLLGFLSDGADDVDWVEALTEYQLTRRVAMTDATGERIAVVDSARTDDPYARLELVGEIAEAIARQHLADDGALDADADPSAPGSRVDDDTRRAHAALWAGVRRLAIDRYARAEGMSLDVRPSRAFVHETRVRRRGQPALRMAMESDEFAFWLDLPAAIGPFFVDAIVSPSEPLAAADGMLRRPPGSTMELFRPRWYEAPDRWAPDAVSPDFADELIETPPILTDVLGISGLVAMLRQWYSVDAATTLAGGWTGDRWALWQLPDDGAALMLETRWADETSAIQFHGAVSDDPRWRVVPHREGGTRVRLIRAESADAMQRLAAAAAADAAPAGD